MDAIEKLIEEGEKQLQEEIAEKAERTRIKAEEAEGRRRERYEFLKAILPVEVQPYFDYTVFQDYGNLNPFWNELVIPECTKVFVELDMRARTTGDVEVALPDNGYRREPHRVKNLHIGLALARRYYREEQEIKAKIDEFQRQEDEKMAAAAKREEEITSQAHNENIQLDYLQQAKIASFNGDMAAATGFALIGILQALQGQLIPGQLDEIDQSVKIRGSDGS